MPVREDTYAFLALSRETFRGLPGLLADALPDKFGNRLIDVWTGRGPDAGARTSAPSIDSAMSDDALSVPWSLSPPSMTGADETLSRSPNWSILPNRALDDRAGLVGRLGKKDDGAALGNILSVGTSAGGARAKAVLAWNPKTGEFRSGQVDTDEGFEHWILKFDGISENCDRELADPQGFGRIEYAYHLMARAAGIEMPDCRLHHEGGRSHFMTRRFDRDAGGRKIHMQSLGALQHFDFNQPGAYAYEQTMQTIRDLKLGISVVEEQCRRTIFNIVARNQDDHVKNIAFLMNRKGAWRLSPAYDVAYACNPSGPWTRDHQMSMAGKRNDFERADMMRFAESSGLKKTAARRILDDVISAVTNWRHWGIGSGRGEERRSPHREEAPHHAAVTGRPVRVRP